MNNPDYFLKNQPVFVVLTDLSNNHLLHTLLYISPLPEADCIQCLYPILWNTDFQPDKWA